MTALWPARAPAALPSAPRTRERSVPAQRLRRAGQITVCARRMGAMLCPDAFPSTGRAGIPAAPSAMRNLAASAAKRTAFQSTFRLPGPFAERQLQDVLPSGMPVWRGRAGAFLRRRTSPGEAVSDIECALFSSPRLVVIDRFFQAPDARMTVSFRKCPSIAVQPRLRGVTSHPLYPRISP